MISVMVSCKVKQGFIDQNKANIANFFKDFKQLDASKFQYHVFCKQDGLTFVHHSMYQDEEIQKKLLSVPSFLEFQRQRDEYGLDGKPEIEFLDLIHSSDQKWK